MTALVTPCAISGNVNAVGSKSYAHRALIAAGFLQDKPFKMNGITYSDDVNATINCLQSLGVNFSDNKVYPCKTIPKTAILNVNESASTLRFLLPLVASLGVEAEFICSKTLKKRPIAPLLQTLTQNGVKVDTTKDGYKISGKLNADHLAIDSSLSSQYVTGLMFSLAYKGGGSLCVTGKKVSSGYIDITADVLNDFGVSVKENTIGYQLTRKALTNQGCSEQGYTIEGDWSNSAFFLTAAALGGSVTVKGLNLNSKQKDKKILSVLKKVGADVTEDNDLVTVKANGLRPFELDAEDLPDLVPILSVLAAFCNGKSLIKNISRLKIKESDRVEEILKTLKIADITAVYDGDLTITGGTPKGGNFTAGDHRIAMAQTILALYSQGKSRIYNAECVKKSYPSFYEDVNKLGGNFCVALER